MWFIETLLNKEHYLVRYGDFGSDGNTKILYSLLSCCLAIDDYYSNNSTDCFFILIGSTIIWSIIELLLHLTSTRIMKTMYLTFQDNTYVIPKYISLFLQGFQEGGFITTLGLYFGDRIFSFYHLIGLHLLIIIMILHILIKSNKVISSKRFVNSTGCLAIMMLFTIYNLFCFINKPLDRIRQLKFFIVMIYFSSIWTFFTWYGGFRNVDSYNNGKKESNKTDTVLILLYDIIFEIGFAYLTFYNLFIKLKNKN